MPAPHPDGVQQLLDLAISDSRCAKCDRKGRRRSWLVDNSTVIGVSCDMCWFVYGGADGFAAALAAEHEAPFPEQDEVTDESLGDQFWAELHPVDQFLITCGIGWRVLRWVPRAVRVKVALGLKLRRPPEGTQRATSPQLWLDEAAERIALSHDFHQRRSRDTCFSVAEVYTWDLRRTGRPLVWLTQDTAAAAIGKCTKTVQRALHWYQQQELLHEVVPGLQLDRMSVPEHPTEQERAEGRLRVQARLEAAEASEAASMARARAEVELKRKGYAPRQAAAEAARRHPIPEVPVEDESFARINVAPVYELRIPIPAEVLAERAAIERAQALQRGLGNGILEANRNRYVDVRNAVELGNGATAVGADGTLAWVDSAQLWNAWASGALTSTNVVGFLRGDENVHPPRGFFRNLQLLPVRPVEDRPASPGSWTSEFGLGAQIAVEPSEMRSRRSEALKRPSRARRAAQELLSVLDPALAEVSARILEALIAPWLHAGWSTGSILRRIHGSGVPIPVHSPRAYIKYRLRTVPTGLSPDQRAEMDNKLAQLTAENTAARKHRVDELARAKRRQITDCPLCDEYGWVVVDIDDDIAARCSHDPTTGGW